LHFSGTLPLVTVSAWDTAPVVIAMAFVVFSMLESELSPNLPKRALFQVFTTACLQIYLDLFAQVK
jgi:hypothetical protein